MIAVAAFFIMKNKIIISLFDYTGNWSKPFADNGYEVVQVDIRLGIDIYDWNYTQYDNVVGILAAVPCTDFSRAGAQLWKQKDADGRTEKSVQLANHTLNIIEYFEAEGNLKFWVIENPVGRIEQLVPRLKGKMLLQFQPWQYGDGYTKHTRLWGNFNPFLKMKPVKPVKATRSANGRSCNRTSLEVFYKKKGTKVRSITHPGFAKAFFDAQQLLMT